ncbi:MAG: flavin reductase family protein [Deltaproteobacteria bacterium]|nr:flavin reductase family protein [Deltaproteobacteria bacterium]
MKRIFILKELDFKDIYFLFTQTIIPRPIAWVTTKSRFGGLNLAPFSYFNAVSSNPPLIMISFTGSPKKGLKDTLRNITDTGEFTINLPRTNQIDAVVKTAAEYEYGVDEARMLGLELESCKFVQPEMLKDCFVSFECVLEKILDFGELSNGGVKVIFGKVLALHVEECAFEGERINPKKLDPLCRLGRDLYASLGGVYSRKIPKV